jgi:hypothetical protein
VVVGNLSQRDCHNPLSGAFHPDPVFTTPLRQGFDLQGSYHSGATHVTMVVDMTERSLGFRLNGQMGSVADTGIRLPEAVQLWVWACHQGDTVSLSRYWPRGPSPVSGRGDAGNRV